MDPATEAALKAAFIDANVRLGGRWKLVPETEAGHVMVDMDSMYGPMSWLRLHAAGKRVIGLTTAPRAQTDFRLGRPFDSDAFATLLRTVATDHGVVIAEVAAAASIAVAPPITRTAPSLQPPVDASAPTRARAQPEAAALPSMAPAGFVPTSAPPDQPPEKIPLSIDVQASAPPEPAPAADASAPPHARALSDWLAPGALTRRVRYRRQTGPTLLIDPAARSYHGPSTLKPFAAYFDGVVVDTDFDTLDDATWAHDSAAAGAAQPLRRLQWLGALAGGHDALLAEIAAQTQFRLNKWPQTEREYPKHFRIATAMMKGPATLAEIAEASAMPVDEVVGYVNASLASGFAERVVDTPPGATEPPKPTGLLGRLRGR
ncbi:MAG: hypothetical protein ACREO8_06885 [Luteimonas sp.]